MENQSSNHSINLNKISNSTSNLTLSICAQMIFSWNLKNVIITSYVVIFIVGSVGNAAVIYIIGIRNKLIKSFDFYILSLAVADLISSVFVPIVSTHDLVLNFNNWLLLGNIGCKLFVSIDHVTMLASSFMLILISVERLR